MIAPPASSATNPATQNNHSAYLDALARGILVYDGAMGTNIQRWHLTAEDYGGKSLEGCNDNLVLTRPDVIQSIHESFLAVGCDVVETCTFQSTPRRLEEWGLKDKVRDINVGAAQLARKAADKYSTPDKPRFVAGSIGPTGMLPSSSDPVLSAITFEELAENYYWQAKYLVEGGVDVLLVETAQDILEVKAAIAGFERLFAELGRRIPIQAQVTLDTSGRMLLGTDMASALTTLEALPVDVIGLNCSTGPEHMREPVRFLSDAARRPLSVIPNAGLPLNTGTGDAVYPLEPAPMAAQLEEFVAKYGVRIVGGCCGTTPEHLAAIVAAVEPYRKVSGVGGQGSGARVPRFPGELVADRGSEPRVSSAMRATTLRQDPAPLLVGERVNSQGSRKMKRLLLADDYEGILEVARDQVDAGAHVLDVCVALTERADEAAQMSAVVKLLSMSVETPLMIDSTEANVIEAALEHVPGRAIINSINMENGRKRIDSVVPIAKKHGAALVALTIDPEGMAKTRERKLEVARKIFDIVVHEYGLAPEDLIFDCLTFTLATGDEEWLPSAKETIEGIRLIKKELPGVMTILGVSNVSFGLSPEARGVLNSVFLHHCVEAGLDAAIVNPAHITPYAEIGEEERGLANDMVWNTRPDSLQRFIEHFAATGGSGVRGQGVAEASDPYEGLTADQRVHKMVLTRKKEGIEDALDAAGVREKPVRVLNEVLLPAMKEVGDKFGAGELILPFVLQSAEVMKRAVKHLEQFLERAEGYTKGKV
ncbi:MAG TPA: homocysteine S-methyltransferase family protein, partial [Gemmatimonadaceae bacterium]|nr:homocysteine S-methyltransferase family protein [Gemmatimonadaceae bacterium]